MSEAAKKIPRTIDKTLLTGIWRMKYRLTNRMGPQGFSGRLLSTYTDPLTGVARHLYNEYGDPTPGYFIENQVTIFRPETNPAHANIVDWLIGHPLVSVEEAQTKLDKKYYSKKESNPRISLVNLDFEEVADLKEEDYIDKLIGRIVIDGGPQALGTRKLRFILAKLDLMYIELKYVKNPVVEKQKLRKTLKTFIRKNYENAEKVNRILDNLVEAEYIYTIKEMIRKEILYISGGMYKYNNMPIAASTEGVIKYFSQNVDFYAELTKSLYVALKKESSKEE